MRIHHLNCISTCPLGGRLMDGPTPSTIRRGELACHCLLLEAGDGLVLVDTGLGTRDVANPRSRRLYKAGEGENWFGLSCVRALEGLSAEVLLIPLVGHTFGHAGVAIDGGKKWLLQAGDAYFYHREMDLDAPSCTPGLRFYQAMMEKNRRARLWNQERLRNLRRDHSAEVAICCSHDPTEFEALAGRALRQPAIAAKAGRPRPVPEQDYPAPPGPRHQGVAPAHRLPV